MNRSILLAFVALMAASTSLADDDTVKAAVGGGLGGAAGAAIGEEVGDRKGAIIGGAIGGAVGAAIAVDEDESGKAQAPRITPIVVAPPSHPGRHCPPGQAKKGRC